MNKVLKLLFAFYLSNKGIDNSDLPTGLRELERLLGEKAAIAIPGVSKDLFKGAIYSNGEINPKTSLFDIERAFNLLDVIKRGQAVLDAIDTEEEVPLAFKWNKTQEDSKIETGDPIQSQQIGKMEENIPGDFFV